ncbi:MAG: anti-anti-sigma factor [Planctomycetaceae bacterium]|nr:anti-anti-sigma factor [Planctomycetaceae bacterium]
MDTFDGFSLTWHGNCLVVVPASTVESISWDVIDQAADIVLAPIRSAEVPMVVFDLTGVRYFGSVFLALLLRCHKNVKAVGGELVLCGPSEMARELLEITQLDTIWAIYDTRDEALSALQTF